MLGTLGYIAAVTIATILAIAWQFALGQRLVSVLASLRGWPARSGRVPSWFAAARQA